MKFIIWVVSCISAVACGLCLQDCEQVTFNPYTDSCDYIQRLDDSQVQVVCTVVQHVR